MMKKGIVALVLLVAAVPFFVHAYTSPGKPTGFVNDFANILTVEQKAGLEATLSDLEKNTGDEISIVTVPSLGDETVEMYANKLFKEWGIGKKGKDNGLLILHAPNERKVWIEVGYGLEPVVTDAKASSIYRNILTPRFKARDYVGGYTEAVTAIMLILNGKEDVVTNINANQSSDIFGEWIFWILLAPLWLASILGRSKSWWFGGVVGGIGGIIIGTIYGFIFAGIIAIPVLAVVGLIFDFIVSRAYNSRVSRGLTPPWWIGGGGRGGGGGFGGGGFGGFGGGGSGGGGGGGGY